MLYGNTMPAHVPRRNSWQATCRAVMWHYSNITGQIKKGKTVVFFALCTGRWHAMAPACLRCRRENPAWPSHRLRWYKPGGTPLCTRQILTTNTILFAYSVETDMNTCHWKMA